MTAVLAQGDWLRERLLDAQNRGAWHKTEGMSDWLAQARLDRFTGMLSQALTSPRPQIMAIVARLQAAQKPGLMRLQALLDEAETAVR